jgi:sulfane dehydrogenase subunit SoxC
MKNDQLKNEAIYAQDRMDRELWSLRQRTGLSRRRLLQWLSVGGGAAALGIIPGLSSLAHADHTPVIKPTPEDKFYNWGTNREMRFEAMKGRGYLTPNELFFVRNHTSTPHLNPDTWRLRIEGSGVRKPVELTYEELIGMPSVTETKFLECAGNFRSQYEVLHGKKASGTQWRSGSVGVAEWTGVPLSRVLERAGVKPTAKDVMPEGLDSMRVRRPMPIEKALDGETLLVYKMNGEVLPPDHGFPVRLLLPGWIGVANVKWVGRIEVSEELLSSPWNTTSYRMFGEAYPDSPIIFSHDVKSAFELAWGGSLPAGRHVVTGRSWSAHGKIAKVEVSTDGGGNWRLATLLKRNIPKAWVQWEIPWNATPGSYHLMARATDEHGNVQPLTIPFNDQGYKFWAVVKHPVTVV